MAKKKQTYISKTEIPSTDGSSNTIVIEHEVFTRDQMEVALGEYCAAEIERRRLQAELDAELQAVRERYNGKIDTCDQTLDAIGSCLEAWAIANKSLFEGEAKSIATIHGRIGFRTSTPSAKLLGKKWNWELVCERARDLGVADLFVRTVEEPDKENMIKYHAGLDEEAKEESILTRIGVKIDQPEKFFIDPSSPDADTAVVTQEAR